ncbi:MAG: hypothetical protein LQ345_005828 [Seirophora villosa]|nr:MAG: hypothetical protein LQ345_005828 [Seirophora villosa]
MSESSKIGVFATRLKEYFDNQLRLILHHAQMSQDRTARNDSAWSALVESLIRPLPDEDDASHDQRRDDAKGLAASIINGHPGSSLVPDVHHLKDLIRQQVQNNGDTQPEKDPRVCNVLSRLLEHPVLSRKQAVLLFLFKMAEGPMSRSESSQHGRALSSRNSNNLLSKTSGPGSFEDAFASNGLPPLPAHEDRSRRGKAVIDNERQSQRSRDGSSASTPGNELADEPNILEDSKPTEASLLHDLPFTLQGLSTKHLPFSSRFTLDLPPTLPLPMISLLRNLAEPSLLYRSLSDFVDSQNAGLVAQSLRSAIGMELRSYLGLIATLEGEIRRAMASIDPKEPRGAIGKAGVTLRRCVVWTREATMGLRLMSLIAEEAKTRKGGQLITMVHSFSSSHGDPFVAAFAERMLTQVTRPFYDMLRQWIYDGELSDPYHEYFVHEHALPRDSSSAADARRAPATSVWEDKYTLKEDMIPSIITQEFARKVFLIGKSLNFIRHGCGDSAWVEAYCKDASRELQYGDTATLEISIDKAYKTTMARLIDLMDNKFQLFEHLRALKKYLLLGQGDFIALLMESLASNLDRPAGSQYRHTLTAQLEHAIRGSSAQYDSPEVLRRLDARLLELSHGEIGWDVFTLEYKVDAPVDVVITVWASKQYLIVFNFLWRIKRVEFALGSTWRRCMTGARGVLATVDTESGRDWKHARCCIAEMIHFVNQLQYYILFEVIEASWDQLEAAITKPGATLDDLIEAHIAYLEAIVHKGLLGSARSSLTGSREDSFASQLHHILKTMLAYKDVVDGLYSFCVAEFTRRQEKSARFETQKKKKRGPAGIEDEDPRRSPSPIPAASAHKHLNPTTTATANNNDPNHNRAESPFPISTGALLATTTSAAAGGDSILPALRQRLGDLSKDFRHRVNVLLGDLMAQPDADMKFLGTVMNFNDVYSPKKRRREKGAGKTAATVKEGSGNKGAGEKEKEKEGSGNKGEKEKEKEKDGMEKQEKGKGKAKGKEGELTV